MSAGGTVLQTTENGNEGSGIRRMQCPLFGCKRVYTETRSLETHIKDHEIPAQSLPGKELRCSTLGCSASFPNMQKLMEHTRQHHKPNIYFQCESCRTKLRSYRNLLGHLHTCSKVSRGKPKAAEAAPPTTLSAPNPNPRPTDQAPPKLESVSSPQQVPFQMDPNGPLPGADPQPGSSDPPVLGPPILSLQEPPPPPLTEAFSQPPVRLEASNAPPTPNPDALHAAPDLPVIQTQTRSPEAVQPAPGPAASAPPGLAASSPPGLAASSPPGPVVSSPPGPAVSSPPGSSAVWKKTQGMASSRRVLWEHTKGRYTCIQCGHTVTNRKDMNHHIKSQHSGTKETPGNSGSRS